MKYKPFTKAEIARYEKNMSAEMIAVLEIEIEELNDQIDSTVQDWLDGALTYDQGKEQCDLLNAEKFDKIAELKRMQKDERV